MEKHELLNAIAEYAEENLPAKLWMPHREKFVPGKTQIPATYPELNPIDVANLVDTVLNFWYTDYKQSEKFKRLLCETTKQEYATLTNSGSSANLLALTAVSRMFSKKLVLTCATGFPTTVAPIYQNGKIPVYIDIDPFTLQPKYEEIDAAFEKYGNDIAGSIFAHTLGFPYEEWKVSIHHGFSIADGCDALAAKHSNGLNVGEDTDISTYSFFPAHQIFAGECGAVLTDNEELNSIIESLNNWGRSCYCKPGQSNTCGHRFDWQEKGNLPEGYDHKYIFNYLGYNFKPTEFQAALGFSQLLRLDRIVADRQVRFQLLSGFIEDIPRLQTVLIPSSSVPSPFGFPIICETLEDAQSLIAYLEDHKISTRKVFAGNITKQPGYMNLPYIRMGNLDGSDFVMNNVFWIGCHPNLTIEMLHYMMTVIEDWSKK